MERYDHGSDIYGNNPSGGPATYSGVVHDKPYIGDNIHPIQAEDIVRANRLMYAASALTLTLAILFRAICLGVALFGSV